MLLTAIATSLVVERISYLAQMVQPFRDRAAMYGAKPAAGQAIEPDMTNVIAFP